MKKFNISKITKDLEAISANSGASADAAIQLLTNNLEIYNILLKEFEAGDKKQIYLLYQMSATISKNLQLYNIYPDKTDTDKEDSFTTMKKAISKNNDNK